MVRESLRQRFLSALESLGGSAVNGRLQAELGWQDDTYWDVHAALTEDATITKGRGRGGSVSHAASAGNVAQQNAAAVSPAATAHEQKSAPAPLQTRNSGRNGGSAFEQTFKNIDDVLWKEAGCTTELDYTEQTSWILFLKYLDDLEQSRAMEAELVGKPYTRIIDKAHSWSRWAAPRKANGSRHDPGDQAEDRRAHLRRRAWVRRLPVRGIRLSPLGRADHQPASNSADAHFLRQGEEEPRLRHRHDEHMILHGIDAPNIVHTNTLTENLADVQDKDRFNVIMANPPFGGKERGLERNDVMAFGLLNLDKRRPLCIALSALALAMCLGSDAPKFTLGIPAIWNWLV